MLFEFKDVREARKLQDSLDDYIPHPLVEDLDKFNDDWSEDAADEGLSYWEYRLRRVPNPQWSMELIHAEG